MGGNVSTANPETVDPQMVNPALDSQKAQDSASNSRTTILENWDQVLHAYSALDRGSVAARWLKTVTPSGMCEQRTRLVINSVFSRDFLHQHCETDLNQILKDQGFGSVEWSIVESSPMMQDSSAERGAAEGLPKFRSRSPRFAEGDSLQGLQEFHSESDPTKQSPTQAAAQTSFLGNMRQDLTLDRFVVGKSNRVAYEAVRAVLKEPGSKYNPVFLHGGSGLGKTHLLQALTREFFIQGERRIRYLQCEKFVQKFVRALQNKSIHQFREEFRSLKVLAIDDVQMIAGKKRCQEELIETIDAITQAGGQVFLACDLPPRQCEFLQLQLRNRFLAGLVTRMEAPDLETRLSILQRESIRHGIQVPGEVLNYIAQSIRKSVRELLGALTRLFAEVDLRGSRIDLPLARRCLEPLVKDGQRVIHIEMIVESVARRWSVDPVEINSRSRTRTTAMARNVATYLARILTNRSFAEIGSEMGGRTHSTTSSSYRKIRKLMEGDSGFKREVERLVDELRG